MADRVDGGSRHKIGVAWRGTQNVVFRITHVFEAVGGERELKISLAPRDLQG